MPNLLWFEWEKDVDGYRIEELEPEDDAGEKGKTLHLLSIGRAALRYHPLDEYPGMFKEFAHCGETPENAKAFTDKYGFLSSLDKPMSIDYWRNESARMFLAIDVWQIGLKNSDLRSLIEVFNIIEMAPTKVIFRQGWDAIHPALYIAPNNLLSAMWLQFAQAISLNTEFRKCLHCPAWFSFGPGTNRRKTAFYCSARCRRAAHRSREKQR